VQLYLPAPTRTGDHGTKFAGPAAAHVGKSSPTFRKRGAGPISLNEYPQNPRVVLSKTQAGTCARVLSILPEDMALDVVGRMLKRGGGAAGMIEARRPDAAHRVPVQPVTDPPSRRPPSEGRASQTIRRQTETASHRAGKRTTANPPQRITALMVNL